MAVLRTHWIYFAISLVGLVIYLLSAMAQMRTAAVPDGYPLSEISYPARVPGAVVGSSDELAFVLQGQPVGSRVEITDSNDQTFHFNLVSAFSLIHQLVTYVVGSFFWLVSLVFFAPRTDRRVVHDFFWAMFLYGLAVCSGEVYFPSSQHAGAFLFPLFRVFSVALTPVFFVRVSLEFPSLNPVPHRRLLMPFLFVSAISVSLWYSLVLLQYFSQPAPENWGALTAPALISVLMLIVYVALGCVLFYRSGRRAELSRERDQVKWILWGIGIGATPFIYLWTIPKAFGLESLIPLEYARLFAVALPISFAIAVVRYQFMDIDVIIRRSLIYASLAAVMVSLYLVVGVWLGGLIESRFPQASTAVLVASVVIPVILFNPTRKGIGGSVDRMFFKIQTNYQKAIDSLQSRMADASSHQQVVDALQQAMYVHLHPKRVSILVGFQERYSVAGDDLETLRDLLPAGFRTALLKSGLPQATAQSTSTTEFEIADYPKALHEHGYVLVQPLPVEDDCWGVILIGPKTSERRFVEEDLRFIQQTAANAAIILERLWLVQKVNEEELARRQLDELNRLKNDFLSQVAHDLRTPLTSIRWSSTNLLDEIPGEINPDQKEYLEAIHSSSHQLSRLVNNLLEISRMESGNANIEMEDVDLKTVVEASLTSLRPIAKAKGINIGLTSADESHMVSGSRDKLLEVVNNLVENAVKFSPNDSPIEIELRRQDDWQQLSVRDYGPGIKEGENEIIFERYQQSAESTAATKQGFGLGLYVVKSFLELMNGRVWAENHPQGGAQFRFQLPNLAP